MPFDFGMTFDFGVVMGDERVFVVCELNAPILLSPVAPIFPTPPFVGMAEVGPFDQFPEEFLVDAVKYFLGGTTTVVVGPPANDGIEDANQGGLRTASIVANELFELVEVAFDSLPGRFDECFEARSAPLGAGVVLANPILTDGKAQKVETPVAFIRIEGVGDAGFAWFEVQAHFSQPFFGFVLQFTQRVHVVI